MAKSKEASNKIRSKGREKTGSLHNLGGAQDKRQDIQNMFKEIGFKGVSGTNNIDTTTLGAYAIALNGLEKEYGAISASKNPVFTTGNGTSLAAVFFKDTDPSSQFMAINSKSMGSIGSTLKVFRENEKSGWFAKTDGKITSQARQTITHEYGHMLSNALAAKNGTTATGFAIKAYREIRQIAQTKYGAKKGSSPSRYGSSSAEEFFAESFASYKSGSPNAYGKAIGDWLKNNKL